MGISKEKVKEKHEGDECEPGANGSRDRMMTWTSQGSTASVRGVGAWTRTSFSERNCTSASDGAASCSSSSGAPMTEMSRLAHLLRGQPWIYHEPGIKALPLSFLADVHDDGQPYWLHVEGDSSVLRAEKEELVWLLNGGDARQVRSQQVQCIDPNTGNVTRQLQTCGNRRALPGILRHTSHLINLYSWDAAHLAQLNLTDPQMLNLKRKSPEALKRLFVSFSVLGGVQTNCHFTSPCRCPQRLFCHLVGRCNIDAQQQRVAGASADVSDGPGVAVAIPRELNGSLTYRSVRSAGTASARTSVLGAVDACDAFPGTGTGYYYSLIRHVGHLVGAPQPSAIVFAYSGLHFAQKSSGLRLRTLNATHPDANTLATYRARIATHLDFQLASVGRALPSVPIIWRSGWLPQWDPYRKWGVAEEPELEYQLSLYFEESWQAVERYMRNTPPPRLAIIDAAQIVGGWPNATPDNNHFDGGVLREFHREQPALREQVVTLNLLNVLLNRLTALHSSGIHQHHTHGNEEEDKSAVEAAVVRGTGDAPAMEYVEARGCKPHNTTHGVISGIQFLLRCTTEFMSHAHRGHLGGPPSSNTSGGAAAKLVRSTVRMGHTRGGMNGVMRSSILRNPHNPE